MRRLSFDVSFLLKDCMYLLGQQRKLPDWQAPMKEAQFPMTIYIHVQAGRTDPKRSVGFLFGCPYAPMGLSWQS